jgi:large repetitive protein
MRTNGFWIFASAILLAASVVPARANLITDPGFESCTSIDTAAPGWTESSASNFCDTSPHTGTYDNTFFGASSTLSQTIPTVTGDNYDFSFWLKAGGSPFTFTASFGSDEILDLVNPGSFGYKLEDFTVTAAGTSTAISFSGSGAEGAWNLDDVSATDQTPATPEPASLVLMGTGLFAIGWRFRRQRT